MTNVARAVAVGGLLTGLLLTGAGCGADSKQTDAFRAQLKSAGMEASAIRYEKETTKKKQTSKNKPAKAKTKSVYEADVSFGSCKVEFEQADKAVNGAYYLDEVNDAEPDAGLAKISPTRADVAAYLSGPDSPCKP